jgi:hypothetical protein
MRSPPAGFLVKALLMTLNTVPARVVRPIVRAERFDHMRGFAITTLAPMDFEVFYSH